MRTGRIRERRNDSKEETATLKAAPEEVEKRAENQTLSPLAFHARCCLAPPASSPQMSLVPRFLDL